MSNKYGKESYITAASNPHLWKSHVNVKTLEIFSKYIVGSVLDIGCNHAATTYWLKDFDVTDVVGVDINTESLLHAKKHFEGYPKPHSFFNIDYTIDRLDREFDTIVSFHTMEHIYPEDVNSFVNNIYLSLKSGGHFLIGLPYERAYADPCHVGFYNQESLSNTLNAVGFITIECFKDDRWEEKNILTGLFKK